MEQIKNQLGELKDRLAKIKESLDIENMRRSLRELFAQTVKPDFWQDQQKAKNTMSEINNLRGDIESVEKIEKSIEDAYSVLDETMLEEEAEEVKKISKDLDRLESATFLSGQYDSGDAILAIHAGQGGTEAMDWVSMLFRMYLKYAESQHWNTEIIEQVVGEEAGLKSVTIFIKGRFAYGFLKHEAGTHRLVRQSPFNADKLRQTSFALVEVLPNVKESPDLEINDSDLDWQFFRASGHGGQNVQKVSTAVRLTHKPTGIVVTAQTERFQEQNRKIALDLLRSKLWARQELARKEQVKNLKGDYKPAAWGTQIRSYVLHPYKMVRDLRTKVETGDAQGVLDGNLDEFIEAEIKI